MSACAGQVGRHGMSCERVVKRKTNGGLQAHRQISSRESNLRPFSRGEDLPFRKCVIN
jgi:hypothetical protein